MHVVLVASGDLAAGLAPPLKRPHRDLANGVPPTPTDRPAATACFTRRGVAVVA